MITHMFKKILFLLFIKSAFKNIAGGIWLRSRLTRKQIEKLNNKGSRSRQHVIQALEKSSNEFDTLYKKLAK